ncbi:MAG: hypothetical protein K9G70_02215 [Prolixibacteraceae bacterium]|nr:hypothetical protein [Prolixibacteraceae bacterium]
MCFFLTVFVYAQKITGSFYITGRVKVDKGEVEGASIQIVRDGIKWKEVTVNRTGSFRLPVSLGHVYDFIYHKDGYYSKNIQVDTNVPPEACDGDCNFPPYQMAVLLYKKVPGVEEMNTPEARVSYNPKIDNFDAEVLRKASDYSEEINNILLEVKAESKKYEERRKQSKQSKYEALINSADRMFRQGDYDAAIRNYRDALMIFPTNVYPRNQINKSYQLQVAVQLRKRFGLPDEDNFMRYLNYADIKADEREYTMAKVAYEKILTVKPNDEQVKNRLEKVKTELENMNRLAMDEVSHDAEVYRTRKRKYKNLVGQADEKIQNEDFAEARQLYARAATQIDENSYALLMIEKIDNIFNNEELIEKLARERELQEQERLREARNRAYDDAVQEADRLFDQRLYRDAIEYYELALSVKNYELYPKKQIRTIREILADLQLKGEEYNRLVRQADDMFRNEKYREARPVYSSAHELIPDEKYALKKMAEIDRILNMDDAQARKREEYIKYIQLADSLFEIEQYNQSLKHYQNALTVFSDEAYPKTQIAKIRGVLSRDENKKRQQEQIQNDYNRTIALADNAFNQESYQSARTLYVEALAIIPGQEYPQNQIRKIDAILREQAQSEADKSALEQIDFSNIEDFSENLRQEAYKEAMALGNSFIESKEWSLARFYFRRALALIPGDEMARQKIEEVEQVVLGDNANEKRFSEMIEKADEAFETGDFSVARFYYNKARELKADDEYVNERLRVASQLAETTANRMTSREYDQAMQKANQAFDAKNYSVARFFYRKALSLMPDDEKAKQKISEVEQLMGQ